MTKKVVFQQAVIAQINGDKEHGWGVEDSLAVILKIFSGEVGVEVNDIDEDIKGQIKAVINPSAFRQILESKKVLNESKNKRKESATKSLLEGII